MAIKIDIKKYNNKNRKGTYIRLSEPGKKVRVLRYNPQVTDEMYRYVYKHNLPWNTLHQANKIASGQMPRKISQELKKGITQIEIPLSQLATPRGTQEAYKKLLGPLVKDQGLLNLIIQNTTKIRNRFTHEITGYTKESGRLLEAIHIKDIGNRNIEEAKNLYWNEMKLRPGYVVSNSNDEKTRLSHRSRIPKSNISVHESGKRLIKITIKIRFTA